MAAKVLLVEDDNNLREIYEARLMAEGYTIVTAKDGEEALVVAKAELPNLIISDVMMPRISGFEMLDILRNTDNLRDVKVIMLTALGQADDKTRANSLGADRYLVKSQVTLEDIVKAAHELLEGAAPAAPGAAPAPVETTQAPAVAAPPMGAAVPMAPAPEPVPVAPAPAPTLNVQPEPTAPAAASPASPAFNPTLGANLTQPVALATPVAAPTTPVAMPTPVAAPAPTVIAPAPQQPAPAISMSGAPSTSEEQASIRAQIDDFIRTAQPDVEARPAATTAQDDAVLASAMHDLAANAEDQATEPVTPEAISGVTPAPIAAPFTPSTPPNPPVMPTAIVDNADVTSKKVIQPLTAPEPKVGIHELLAREEANGNAAPVAPAAPATTFSPTIAQPSTPTAPAPAMAVPQMASMPAPSSSNDPNSIAL